MRNGNELRASDTHNSSASGHSERSIQSVANRTHHPSADECEDDGWITVYFLSREAPRNQGSSQ
jgi:hypothetical protein